MTGSSSTRTGGAAAAGAGALFDCRGRSCRRGQRRKVKDLDSLREYFMVMQSPVSSVSQYTHAGFYGDTSADVV